MSARGLAFIAASRCRLRGLPALLLGLGLLPAAAAEAPRQGMPAIERSVIAAGSAESSGGAFRLRGSAGQVDAEPLQPARGGVYALTGGFWTPARSDAPPPAPLIFRNGFEAAAPP